MLKTVPLKTVKVLEGEEAEKEERMVATFEQTQFGELKEPKYLVKDVSIPEESDRDEETRKNYYKRQINNAPFLMTGGEVQLKTPYKNVFGETITTEPVVNLAGRKDEGDTKYAIIQIEDGVATMTILKHTWIFSNKLSKRRNENYDDSEDEYLEEKKEDSSISEECSLEFFSNDEDDFNDKDSKDQPKRKEKKPKREKKEKKKKDAKGNSFKKMLEIIENYGQISAKQLFEEYSQGDESKKEECQKILKNNAEHLSKYCTAQQGNNEVFFSWKKK